MGGGAIIGAMLLLPYFATTKGDGVIEASQFEPKAKAALEYYAREGVGYGENKVFNAIYMVGSQDKVVYDYCTGGQDQNNCRAPGGLAGRAGRVPLPDPRTPAPTTPRSRTATTCSTWT